MKRLRVQISFSALPKSVALKFLPNETCRFVLILAKQKQNDSVQMKHRLELQSYQIRNSLTSKPTWSAHIWLRFQTWMKTPWTNFQKILERLQHLPHLHQIKVSHWVTSETYSLFCAWVFVSEVCWLNEAASLSLSLSCCPCWAASNRKQSFHSPKRSSWRNKFKFLLIGLKSQLNIQQDKQHWRFVYRVGL